MPSWHEILNKINTSGSTHDIVRREYLRALHQMTGRNVIVYYSGWLQKPDVHGTEVNDDDKNGFMNVIYKMDKRKGLDLILHTPGGDTAATESIVDYLRSIFGTDIRAIVPQLAMSAGTMIACAAKEILMGKHSSLGPIDPQYRGFPAHGVREEFQRAFKEVQADQYKVPIWQVIISKYSPAFIGECEKAIDWSNDITRDWLKTGMFSGDPDADQTIDTILKELSDHALTKSHARHLSLDKCRSLGLKVAAMEDNHPLQEAVLSVHHSAIHTLSATPAYKIIENQDGIAYIKIVQTFIANVR